MKRKVKVLVFLIAVSLVLLLFTSCNEKIQVESPLASPSGPLESPSDLVDNWPYEEISQNILPIFKEGQITRYTFEDESLVIYISNVTDEAYDQYIVDLKLMGYVEEEASTNENADKELENLLLVKGLYRLNLIREKKEDTLVLSLVLPLSWPQVGYVSMLPPFPDIDILQILGEGDNLTIIAQDKGQEKFLEYVEKVKAAGFDQVMASSDTLYVATSEKYLVTLVRQPEQKLLDIGVYEKE